MNDFIPIIIFIVSSAIAALLRYLMNKSDGRQWHELIETIKKYRTITPISASQWVVPDNEGTIK